MGRGTFLARLGHISSSRFAIYQNLGSLTPLGLWAPWRGNRIQATNDAHGGEGLRPNEPLHTLCSVSERHSGKHALSRRTLTGNKRIPPAWAARESGDMRAEFRWMGGLELQPVVSKLGPAYDVASLQECYGAGWCGIGP